MFDVGVPELLILGFFVVVVLLAGSVGLYWIIRLATRDGRPDPRP